jgi:hypothetical protein
MSLIKLQGNASGTGALTIAAPNTNTDRTLTLPDATTTLVGTADFASQAQAQAGTDNATLMTPLRTEEHMTANALGWGQTWQSVTRSPATTYQNTTGRPIMVFSSMSNSTAIQNFQVSTNGSTWINAGNSQAANAPNQVIVPDGHYYQWTQTAGTTNITVTELR